ncbi:NAD(P)/FAD-dependent oxidoreductase [Methanoplanus sp. FWC-SCC4]|uniref:NAD(P)/FAD-dependent oxidoreductase n=1 Tax=Methanochimaera problematica TaxID=2609417 RepID=A0AA97FFI0_9EURY|nr:NAD(P)/FAD-dependent oxidoreductase [Methanoplanus sp. FWC-SCC4]WOF16491.1 NAD(P)/FAD-dependent oxidoreductase [Methanoplanus sp. FWC-SCC4]
MYDVIVAGGGPVGSSAARFCAEEGLSVLLIEEHADFGRPVQCAGLLSSAAFKECRVSKRSVLNTVSGARVVSGLGSELSFDAGRTKAYVVDRSALDREMAEKAAVAGALIKLKTSVYGVSDSGVLTTGVDGKESFKGKMIIAADGPRSIFSRIYGMKRAGTFLSGVQAEIPYQMNENLVELHPYASPDFFGWVIPCGKNRVRVGLCGEKNVKERFDSFIAGFGRENVHHVTGTIPLGVMPKTYGHRTFFIGDAGGFAKPTSGGGIYTGIRTARHAAETALLCCEKNRFDDSLMKNYEKLWKADIGNELSFGMKMFNLRKKINDETIDSLCRAMDNPGITNDIVKYGDMDSPKKIIKKLALRPSVMRAGGAFMANELKKMILS